ncbi:hypothetical protein [Paenarthrobacter ureafaciens]|uniref:hypothetical protein n=1 Tax=Paenarthrobacter ureafaciens TaxID=37931 RepID=UPI0015BFFD37|nr:hypothetical protein [Paenarthrobacter ureafaciens]
MEHVTIEMEKLVYLGLKITEADYLVAVPVSVVFVCLIGVRLLLWEGHRRRAKRNSHAT